MIAAIIIIAHFETTVRKKSIGLHHVLSLTLYDAPFLI